MLKPAGSAERIQKLPLQAEEIALLIRRADAIESSEITSRDLFLRRREFLRGAGWAVAG
ncbi:MAG: hypothetical protein JRF15_16945, partial [Deltaproteobacteria bacterium]|nr:hypothetical protein [Deltaproteobacteria bacterium]